MSLIDTAKMAYKGRGDPHNTPATRDPAHLVYEMPELMDNILNRLHRTQLRQLMGLSRRMAVMAHRSIGQSQAFGLKYVNRISSGKALYPALTPNVRSVRTMKRLDLSVAATAWTKNFTFQTLQSLLSKVPGLKRISCPLEEKLGRIWTIDLIERTITYETWQKTTWAGLAGFLKLPSPISDAWNEYTKEEHMSVDLSGITSADSMDMFSQLVQRPELRNLDVDLHHRSHIDGTQLIVTALQARQALGIPFETFNLIHVVPAAGSLGALAKLLASSCSRLTIGFSSDDGTDEYEIYKIDGSEATDEEAEPNRAEGSADESVGGDQIGIDVVLESCEEGSMRYLRSLAGDAGAFLRHLVIGQDHRAWFLETPLVFSDITPIVDLVRTSMPALGYLRLVLAVNPVTWCHSDDALARFALPWTGGLDKIELELWCDNQKDHGWDRLPWFALGHNIACLLAVDGKIDIVATCPPDDENNDREIYSRATESVGGMSSDDFGAYVEFLINQPIARQQSLRSADFAKLGLWPIKAAPFSWREIRFDKHDQLMPISHSSFIEHLRQLREQADEEGDESSAHHQLNDLRDMLKEAGM